MDILFCVRQNRKPVSVLTCHLSSRPTPRKRASNSFALADAPIYMVFLVLVPSPPYVAIQRRELLPRGFTLTLIGRSVFCYGLHKITPICDFHSRILCPVRTFLWCEHQRKMFTPVALRRQPRGACGLHVVQTGDLSSFRLLRRHGPGRDGWCRPGIPITSVLNQRQIVLPISYIRACAPSCHFVR